MYASTVFTITLALWLRRPPRERKILGLNPACSEIFLGSSHTHDLKIGTPVATLPGAWRYRVSAGTGQPGVSILWLGKMESLVCNFYLSMAAHKIVWADPSLRYTCMLLGHQAANKQLLCSSTELAATGCSFRAFVKWPPASHFSDWVSGRWQAPRYVGFVHTGFFMNLYEKICLSAYLCVCVLRAHVSMRARSRVCSGCAKLSLHWLTALHDYNSH